MNAEFPCEQSCLSTRPGHHLLGFKNAQTERDMEAGRLEDFAKNSKQTKPRRTETKKGKLEERTENGVKEKERESSYAHLASAIGKFGSNFVYLERLILTKECPSTFGLSGARRSSDHHAWMAQN